MGVFPVAADSLLQQTVSRGQALGSDVLGRVNEFVRANPAVTGTIAIAGTGLLAAQIIRSRAPKKRKTTRRKRKTTRRRAPTVRRRKKRATHRSPRHKGHKRVSFINKKTGKRVSFLVRAKGGRSHSKRRKR